MILDSDQLRAAMRSWTTGVTVVTSIYDGELHGMTVNSFTSISLEPALVTISLQQATRTHELVTRAKVFGINILSAEQKNISENFASHKSSAEKFASTETETLVTGAPFFKGALAWMDCRIVHTYDAGINTLFIGEVLSARGTGAGDPLIYHNRVYWKLASL